MKDHKGQVIVSSEKQFVYHDSVNRGHVQLPQMVVKCRNLTDTAKIVYGVISGYVYEYGRTAFPSVARIAMCSNCSKKTAIKYIDELVDKGFILKERHGNGRTNTYQLIDVDKITHLHVSEMFWRAVNAVYKEVESYYYEAVYEGVMELNAAMEKEGTVFNTIPVINETETSIREYLIKYVRKEDEVMFIPPNRNKTKPDTATPTQSSENSLGGDAKKAGISIVGISRKSLPDELNKWKNRNFVQYFYKKYLDVIGKHHEETRSKHGGMVGTVLRKTDNDREAVKNLIDAFFEMGYDNPTLEQFCTSGRKAEVTLYVETGKKPYYLTVRDKKEIIDNAKQENSGISTQDFLNRIKQSK